MSKEQNIATQQRMGEAVNSGNLDILDEIMAPDVLDHDPAPEQGGGPQGFKDFFTMMRSAFPDLSIEVEHLVADDDNVAFAYVISGTQDGEFQGIAATGKKIRVRGMQISKLQNGLITERWGSSDELGILQQLGHAPA